MTIHNISTIGLIGAGHIGSQLARLGVRHGYRVVISNSRGPETLADLVAEIGTGVEASTPDVAATAGDIVVVTIPLKNIGSVAPEPLAGKIVIDTNNYYPQRDGRIPALDDASTTTAGLLQAHLPKSKVVKAFNHIYAADLTTVAPPPPPARQAAARCRSSATTRTLARRWPRCSTSSASTWSTAALSPKAGAASATSRPTYRLLTRRP